MQTRARRGTLAPVVALAVGAWALAGEPLVHAIELQILATAAFVAALALIGVHRSRAATGSADPFHPLAFPLIYVAFSFLAPLWLADVLGHAAARAERQHPGRERHGEAARRRRRGLRRGGHRPVPAAPSADRAAHARAGVAERAC